MIPSEFLRLIDEDPDKARGILLKIIVKAALDGGQWEAAKWLLGYLNSLDSRQAVQELSKSFSEYKAR